tara:strand:+ start:177 stop:566 length:390 start_codon:yes stop_codon:yes gene_type:complete
MFFLLVMTFFTACNSQPTAASDLEIRGGDVPVAKAKELINSDTVTILDVRTADEYRLGHIKDATNIDFYGDDFDEQIEDLPKNKTYLVYCHSGGRSAKSMKMMQDKGYTVYNMEGGISAWTESGEDTMK